MTDTAKYSNISVSKETYSYLQKLSKEILPGNTPLSISKTVTYLVNCKIKEINESVTNHMTSIIDQSIKDTTDQKIPEILNVEVEKLERRLRENVAQDIRDISETVYKMETEMKEKEFMKSLQETTDNEKLSED